jgi:hypothetical protein
MANDGEQLGWAVAVRRKKPQPTQNFDEAAAQLIEAAENIRGLAATLRGNHVNRLIDSGFEYVGVMRGRDGTALAINYEFTLASVPVQDNRWRDMIILRRPCTRSISPAVKPATNLV